MPMTESEQVDKDGGWSAPIAGRSSIDGRLPPLPEANDLIEDALGDFPLGGFRDIDDLITRNDGDGVAIGVEPHSFARDVIDHNRVEVL